VKGRVPEYQMSAFLMAVFFRGMTPRETAALTEAMRDSGEVFHLEQVDGIKVDKHSTGGVGDKVSLVVAPLVAAAGVPVPMVSGRGLGHTGGTLDKLESIPGLRTDLSPDAFIGQVRESGLAIMGQSERIAPADGKLYALRDVTGTVGSVPLIASSIMCKKLAVDPDGLVFDIKVGQGAVLTTEQDIRRLAGLLNRIGRAAGMKTVAVLTRMDQPLGRAVGNAVEVAEAIGCLSGEGPKDLLEVTLALGAQMLLLAGAADDETEARDKLQDMLRSGAGLRSFREMVRRQGGREEVVDDPGQLPEAPWRLKVSSPGTGYIGSVNALEVGRISVRLGAGRQQLDDRVDHSVGVLVHKKVGDAVSKGEIMAEVLAGDEKRGLQAAKDISRAVVISEQPPDVPSLVMDIVEGGGDEPEETIYR